MSRAAPWCWMVLLCLIPLSATGAEEGKVTLPVSIWEGMLDRLEADKKPTQSPIPVCPIERKIDGVFRKGLFHGTLAASFEVLDTRGHIRVPVLDSSASLGEVLLNGERTSLLPEGGLYTLGVDKPGTYRINLKFYMGREQDRFARRLRFRLPDSGSTQVSVLVPETDIEAKLTHGALVSHAKTAGGTRLVGNLDASGTMDLSWTRKLTHREKREVRLESRLHVLFTIQEGLVTGQAYFDLKVLEGETDRVDLRIPAGVEVGDAAGDAVLQSVPERTEGDGRLTVLLRHLVDDQLRISVPFRYDTEMNKPVKLRMPLPPEGAAMVAFLGVQTPAGLSVRVASRGSAKELEPPELPPELQDLTANPMLFGFELTAPTEIRLAVARHDPVELTSTLIDEIQASTVLIEDGTEVTKIKLRIRNNTEQYLTMYLPEEAVLTHALIDGESVPPAKLVKDGREALMFPLRQSERVDEQGGRYHQVQAGETLSDIANNFYSDPAQWQFLLDNNPGQLDTAEDLSVGQRLLIPTRQGVTVEESVFVIELAFKLKREPLGNIGRVTCRLPEVADVQANRVTWHLYFPTALMPLAFDANLTQYSFIRYDPFRRIRNFLNMMFDLDPFAWAGGKYKSILRQRKAIYRIETLQLSRAKQVVLAAFPLTGERYRFKRVLLGDDTPEISVTYVDATLAIPVRWGGFLLAFVLGLLLLSSRRRLWIWITAGVSLVLLLVLAHFFLGLHRRILWGVDLALIVTVVWWHAGPLWRSFVDILRAPWTALDGITLRNLAFLVGLCFLLWVILTFPPLLSTVLALALFFWWRWRVFPAGNEVRHA